MEPNNEVKDKTVKKVTRGRVLNFLRLEKELEQIHLEERFGESEEVTSDFVNNYVHA